MTVCAKALSNLPPLSKGGGLTARHKLLIYCVCLQYIRLLYYKLFCRQDGGIVTQPSPVSTLPKPHYPSKSTISLPALEKGEVLLLGQAEPTMVGIVNALVVFMVVLLSIPIPSHRTTPSKTALSHSLFVGRGACPPETSLQLSKTS